MVDLGGPRIPGWTPPGNVTSGVGSGARQSLQTGTRIEVRVLEVLADRGVRLRLEPSTGRGGAPTAARPSAPAPVVTAQLTGALPTALLNRPGPGASGTAMLAEITRTEPRLEVRLLPLTMDRAAPRPASGGSSANSAQQWLGQELRQQLPGSRPLGPALHGLLTPATGAPATNAIPGAQTPPALQRILELLPTPGQLAQPETLRQHIQQSGLWMEAMLGHAGRSQGPMHPFAADIKAQLLRAADQVRQGADARPAAQAPPATASAPPAMAALSGLLEGLLKRVTSLQLQSLQSFASDEPGNSRWFFELPLRSEQGIHGVFGEIHREGGNDDEAEPPWSIVLTLDIGDLGPTRIALASRNGGVSVHFTALEAGTVTRLRSEMAYLRDRLGERDLNVTGLSVRQGEVDTDPRPANSHRMLDEQA